MDADYSCFEAETLGPVHSTYSCIAFIGTPSKFKLFPYDLSLLYLWLYNVGSCSTYFDG